MVFFIPICCQFGEGVNNPCKCKIIGPTLGFVGFVLTAIVCWPAGACMYCCCRDEANNCFGTPARVNESTSMAIPF
ncbi:g6135 [Coccomyxa viridis]|uniref:G6135 protein n=1 Tax=Coccomyxa viridis TaxID=1274662 RepID=A0ABP1FX58_9CHLO